MKYFLYIRQSVNLSKKAVSENPIDWWWRQSACSLPGPPLIHTTHTY